MTIVLALSVSRMARVHTIVRRLPSVETLGAVSVVCSDKTGTLTMNRMTVEEVLDAGELLDEGVSGRRRRPGRGKGAMAPGQEELLRAFVLCNDAELNKKGRIGDPGELALLEYAEKEGPWTKGELERQFPRTAERAFDPERKRMTTVHRTETGTVSYTKGAPDVILERCSRYLSGGGERPLTGGSRRRLQDRISWLSGQGLRVLGAARSDGDGRKEEDMVFLGLAAMADPPRPEAAHAVAMFKRAHVRTVMITGDHRDTALAIARRLGIAEDGTQCISGAELDRMDDAALKERAETAAVFSRVSPDHKVRIVRALKENGSIVAMTGDGVNDAPSLKAADVGIAMGQTGTDVAKQAADMVLTDDNFATIEKAIEEGRGVYENIKKAVIFLLSSNFGEIMTMLRPLPFPAIAAKGQSYPVDQPDHRFPAGLALGTDKNDGPALMEEPPRGKDESLFSRGGMACTLFYGFLIAVISLTAFLRLPVGILTAEGSRITLESLSLVLGDPAVLARCQTYAFTVLGLSQLFHAVGMRDVGRSVFRMNHLENRLMLAAAVLGVFLQVLVTENSRLVALFQTAALSGTEWRELLFLAAAPWQPMSFWQGSAGSLERGGRLGKNGPDHKSFRIPRRIRTSPPVRDGSRDRRDPGSWRLFSRASALFLPRKTPRRTEVKLRNRERKKRTAREAPASPAPRPAAPLSEESPMARKKEPEAESCFVPLFPGTEAETGLAVKRENPRSMRRLALKKTGSSSGSRGRRTVPRAEAAASTAAGQKARIHAELLGIFIFPVPQTKLTAKESAQRAAVKRKSEDRSPIFIPYLQKITYDIILAGGIFGSRYSNLNGKLIQ